MTRAHSTVLRDGELLTRAERRAGAGRPARARRGRRRSAPTRGCSARARCASQEASLTGESEAVLEGSGDARGTGRRARRPPRHGLQGHGGRAGAPAARSSRRPAWRPRWARSPRMLDETVEEPTPLQKEVGALGRMLGIARRRHRDRRGGHHRARSRTSARPPTSSRCCCSASRSPSPRCPKGCRRSCRWCSRSACSAWRSATPIVKKLSSRRDAGLGIRHLLRQDRHADAHRDDDRARRHRVGHRRPDRRRLRTRSAARSSTGRSCATAPLRAEASRRAQRRQSLANDAQLRRARRRVGDPGRSRPRRRSWSPSASSGHRPSGASRFERVGEMPFSSERKMMSTSSIDHEHGDELLVSARARPTCCSSAARACASAMDACRSTRRGARRRSPTSTRCRTPRCAPWRVAYRPPELANARVKTGRRSTSRSSTTWSSSARSASSTRRAPRRRPAIARGARAPASASS